MYTSHIECEDTIYWDERQTYLMFFFFKNTILNNDNSSKNTSNYQATLRLQILGFQIFIIFPKKTTDSQQAPLGVKNSLQRE